MLFIGEQLFQAIYKDLPIGGALIYVPHSLTPITQRVVRHHVDHAVSRS